MKISVRPSVARLGFIFALAGLPAVGLAEDAPSPSASPVLSAVASPATDGSATAPVVSATPLPQAPAEPATPPVTPDMTPLTTGAATAAVPSATPALPLVKYEALLPFLPPAPAGWTAENPQGSTTNTDDLKLSTAQRSFYLGDDQNALTASVTIIDAAGNPGYLDAATANWQLTTDNADGFDRAVEIDGLRAFEHYSKAAKGSSLSVFVANRYYIQVELTNQDPKELREWLKRIDVKKLSELK